MPTDDTTDKGAVAAPKDEKVVARVAEMLRDIPIAMLVTHRADGSLHSRPMAAQKVEFDGDLWFFTGRKSAKVLEIERDSHVNASFCAEDDNRYVSICGQATFVDDAERKLKLWDESYERWFDGGAEDPDLLLLKVCAHSVEIWDSPSSGTRLLLRVAAEISGDEAYEGDHARVDLD